MSRPYGTNWEVVEGKSMFAFTVLTEPETPGGARTIVYQGDSREIAHVVAASMQMRDALQAVEQFLRDNPKAGPGIATVHAQALAALSLAEGA